MASRPANRTRACPPAHLPACPRVAVGERCPPRGGPGPPPPGGDEGPPAASRGREGPEPGSPRQRWAPGGAAGCWRCWVYWWYWWCWCLRPAVSSGLGKTREGGGTLGVSECLYLGGCVCLSVCVSVPMSVCLYLCLCVCPCPCACTGLCVCACGCLSVLCPVPCQAAPEGSRTLLNPFVLLQGTAGRCPSYPGQSLQRTSKISKASPSAPR